MTEERKQKPKLELAADPKLPFYITAWLDLDGSIDLASEEKDPLSLREALESAKEQIEEYGDDAIYVIECRAVRRVTKGKIRVEPFKTKATR